jgi:hypothetical protein
MKNTEYYKGNIREKKLNIEIKFVMQNLLFILVSILTLICCQEYADYARGAGLARRRNNRLIMICVF